MQHVIASLADTKLVRLSERLAGDKVGTIVAVYLTTEPCSMISTCYKAGIDRLTAVVLAAESRKVVAAIEAYLGVFIFHPEVF